MKLVIGGIVLMLAVLLVLEAVVSEDSPATPSVQPAQPDPSFSNFKIN